MSRMGVNDATVTHPTTTLEDLFIRIVRDNTPGAGGEVGAASHADGNGNGASKPRGD